MDKCLTILHIENSEDGWTDKESNCYVCETAGFVPLEVKFKQFEQNGIRAQFRSDDFDSSELRDIYLGPNTCIYPDDDLEDVEAKIRLQEVLKTKIKNVKLAETDERREEVQASNLDEKEKNEDDKGNS